uniref:Saposin A-type domain-containing protein n=1 Tax=Steinernema glaseri TaxID=37863 RepID=A0A1I7Y5Z0_9BILA
MSAKVSVTLFLLFQTALCLQCSLPPDFWCDHPDVERICTGSNTYCENYRFNVPSGKVSMKIAFEAHCPDSQAFVVDRLYRQVINNPEVSSLADVKAVPWGLAKRLENGSVQCHHKERECIANRHISCAFHHLKTNEQRNRMLYCIMNSLLYRGRIADSIVDCVERVGLPSVGNSIIACANSTQSVMLQQEDEKETQTILTNEPRFVPYIKFGDKPALHMQYYQLFLDTKIAAMSSTLRSLSPRSRTPPTSKCTTPPDFWCSTSDITKECFNENGCTTYLNTIYGQPIDLTIIYDSSEPTSRHYITNYIAKHLIQSPEVRSKVRIKIRAAAITPAEERACAGRNGTNCHDYAIQECIANKVANKQEISKLLHCLLDAHQTPGDMYLTWAAKCHFMQDVYNMNLKEDVLYCASTQEWRVYWRRRLQMEATLTPEPKSSDPWIIINGYSLKSMQTHSKLLHKMICTWYRGPGHNRDLCGRCDYEPTHC